MFGSIPELGCQVPELGRSDEIQNYLHGRANAHDPFGVMDTIVCPELVASRQSARAVMCVKTPANYIEVTNTLMTVSESYRLCGHKSKPLCRIRGSSSLSCRVHSRQKQSTVVQVCRLAGTSRELYNS